jgi:hypothetical protein
MGIEKKILFGLSIILWRDLTKVISILYYSTRDRHVPAGNQTQARRAL